MGRKSATKTGSIVVKQTDDGLHLANSILWFDSQTKGDLSFLSSATSNYLPKVPQVIATEETVRILEACRKRPNALICQYNRPFSIGRLKMELLPSGCVLGGASLYVETDAGRLLYAPQLQPNRVPTVRQMQLKRANTLILGVSHPEPGTAMPNRKREKDRLLDTVKALTNKGEYPLVVCEPVAMGQELTKLFCEHEVPLAVHDTIFKINKVYEGFGSMLGAFSKYSSKHTRQRVVLVPKSQKGKLGSLIRAGGISRTPILYVDSHPDEIRSRQEPDRFFLSPSCDGPEIKEIVHAVNPKELYVFGPYAKRYVEELKGLCPIVLPLFANGQPTLL